MADPTVDEKRKMLTKELSIASKSEELALETFLRLLTEKNAFYSTQELRDWLVHLRKTTTMKVSRQPIAELDQWVTGSTGEITHTSGGFYEIVGVRVENADREVSGWDQPLVYQQEMGILGILCTHHEGTQYYLLQGKSEPGNVDLVQISPTLQATYANLKQLHEGKKPPFSEYFQKDSGYTIKYKQWLAEDGGRFLGKTNLNMIVEVEKLIKDNIPDNYRWFTLRQIKELLHDDNAIGPHVRSIIAHL